MAEASLSAVSAQASLQAKGLSRSRKNSKLSIKNSDERLIGQVQPSQTQTAARSIALIDSFVLSHECMLDTLSTLPGEISVSSFYSIEECVIAPAAEFGLIVIYLHSYGSDTLKALAALRAAHSTATLFLISDQDYDANPYFVRAALKAGAKGLVSTRTTGLSLAMSALHFVQAGGFFAPREVFLGQPSVAASAPPAESTPFSLTARENAVMALLREGKPNKLIARELDLSNNTVKVHIHNILRKMSVANRTEAVSKALPYFQQQPESPII